MITGRGRRTRERFWTGRTDQRRTIGRSPGTLAGRGCFRRECRRTRGHRSGFGSRSRGGHRGRCRPPRKVGPHTYRAPTGGGCPTKARPGLTSTIRALDISSSPCDSARAQSVRALRRVEGEGAPESRSRLRARPAASAVARVARSTTRAWQQPVSPRCAAHGDSANPASLEREHNGELLHQDSRR